MATKSFLSPCAGSKAECHAVSENHHSQPVTVAFVLPRLGAGGAERVMITLMNSLDRRYYNPVLIAVTAEGELRAWVSPSIPVIDLGRARVSLGIGPLWRTLRQLRPAIVVSTMVHMNLACLLLRPFLPRHRLIVREAIVPSFFFDQLKFPGLMKLLYRIFYPLADAVISPAQIMIDEFKSVAGVSTRNHILLYNPVDVDRMRTAPADMTLPMRDGNRVHFVCAGRLHHQKGFDLLIGALSTLPRSMDWDLTILGDGEERENLARQIQGIGLAGRVFLPGMTTSPWPVIAAADAFLLPSRWEGLPNVALESLSVGTPVIAMNSAGGIQEIASMAPAGAVTVVSTLRDFIDAMTQVKADVAPVPRPSLLPDTFLLSSVIEKFSAILKGAA